MICVNSLIILATNAIFSFRTFSACVADAQQGPSVPRETLVTNPVARTSDSWFYFFSRSTHLRDAGVLTDHVPPAPFAIITLVSTFVLLGSWRVAYVKLRGDESDDARQGGIFDGFQMVSTLLRRW